VTLRFSRHVACFLSGRMPGTLHKGHRLKLAILLLMRSDNLIFTRGFVLMCGEATLRLVNDAVTFVFR
jgi:hypothetical protein